MIESKRLNERAAGNGPRLDALWHVDKARTFFAGPLTYNAIHQHGAPVYLAGLYGPFGLRVPGSEWLSCRTAVVPAGVLHELDVGGSPIAVFYVEPNRANVDVLTPLVGNLREINGVLIGSAGETDLMRELYEDRRGVEWAASALDDLVSFAQQRARRGIDPRVYRAVEIMREQFDIPTPINLLASEVGLSASRFQHLFTESVGVPVRRYRAWARMRAAIREIVAGSNFTNAAYAAGFADQAHFARDFRRTFGAPASVSLSKVRGR